MPKPFYLTDATWQSLTAKERDFIVFLRERKWTKAQIMRRLYVETDAGYWKLRKRVSDKIRHDLERFGVSGGNETGGIA